MSAEDLLRFTRRQPFEPFRVKVSGGEVYEVAHPDMMIVGNTSAIIAVPHPSRPGGPAHRVVTVSLLHVIEIGLLAAGV